MFGASRKVGIHHHALIHTLLDSEVEHRFLLAILNS
jgi:hypothetical protein